MKIEHLLQEGISKRPLANIPGLSRRQVDTLVELLAVAISAKITEDWETRKEEIIAQGFPNFAEYFTSSNNVEDDLWDINKVVEREVFARVKEAML